MAASADSIPVARRVELLAAVPAFAGLPPAALASLAAELAEEAVPAGAVVVGPELADDRLFLLVEGRAEATVAGPAGPLPLATLEPVELIGEVDPLMPDSAREATVVAATPLRLLAVAAPALTGWLASHPEARHALAASSEDRLEARFLAKGSHFACLDRDRLRRLTTRLDPLVLPAGAEIVREGTPGDRCFLVRAGRVELTYADSVPADPSAAPERRLTTLGPGTLFGEEAVLADGPHTTTARAVGPCDLLVLRREDLLAAMVAEPKVGAGLVELLHLRARPRRAEGVLVHHREEGGQQATILKDPRRGAYYRLSAKGWFIWQRLDGRRSLRDLTMDYLGEYKAFAPGLIAGEVGELAAAGFVEGVRLRAGVTERMVRLDRGRRAFLLAQRLLDWRIAVDDVDAPLTRLHRGGGRLIYTPPGLLLAALVALAGPAALAVRGRAGDPAVARRPGLAGADRRFLPPAYLAAILVHEAGHALTVKAFGREVPRVGVGWYWVGPVAFVDTSDMWLAGRWPRIAVGAAGLAANLVLAGAAALAARLLPAGRAAALLRQSALAGYGLVLFNLNPLLDYDGAHVLSDLLDRPNVRRETFAWLRTEAVPALRRGERPAWRSHPAELRYASAIAAYAPLAVATARLGYCLLAGLGRGRRLGGEPARAPAATAGLFGRAGGGHGVRS